MHDENTVHGGDTVYDGDAVYGGVRRDTVRRVASGDSMISVELPFRGPGGVVLIA